MFEQQLSEHYESLGYRVTRDKLLLGHQVDLVASKDVSGAGVINVMIEAKFRSKGAVGVNEISNSINAAQALLHSHVVSSAIIIANTAFTAEAKSAVTGLANIQLVTLHDLQQQLFNSSESLLRSVHDYSISDISAEYIGLSATSHSAAKRAKDVAEHIHYNCKYGGTPLILLGDFGSGKTTILQRVFVECANDRLRDASARFPIFLRLQSLRQYPDLWSFISANLRDQQYISPPKHVFESQLKSGRLVVFLDGFDEIYAGASVADRGKYLAQLYPLLSSSSPSVISSRPTYFSSIQEMLGVLNAHLGGEKIIDRTPNDTKTRSAMGKLRKSMGLGGPRRFSVDLFDDIWIIDQLSEKAILSYLTQQESALKATTGKTVVEIRKILDLIYDLNDLMHRPLLLKMVVETVLSGLIDMNRKDLAIGPSALYEAYTQLSFDRDSEKRGADSLSANARRVVCQHLALAMARSGSIELSHAEVRKCIISSGINPAEDPSGTEAVPFGPPALNRQPPGEHSIESVLTDIRLGTFLSFGGEKTLRFGHKSYMEFFVAQFIYQYASSDPDAPSRLGELRLGREVVYFLGAYARDFPKFGQWIVQRAKATPRGSVISRESALRAMFASGLLSNTSIGKVTIQDVELRRTSATRTKLKDLQLREVKIVNLGAISWLVSRCVLEKCELTSVAFSGSEIEIEALDTSLFGIEVRGGSFALSGKRWSLDKSDMRDATVQLRGGGVLGDVRFEGCSLHLMIEGGTDYRFQAHRCTIVSKWDAAAFKLRAGVVLRHCFAGGLVLSVSEVLALLRPRGGTSIDALKYEPLDGSNEGIVFIDTRAVDEGTLERWISARESVATTFAKIVFFDLQLFQRALAMSDQRKATAMQLARKEIIARQVVSVGSIRDDVDAIDLALKLSATIREKNWAEHPALRPLVGELTASAFM